MRESDVEQHLVRQCKRRGVLCEKFTSPGRRAVPDRLLTIPPRGVVVFVECKAPGREPRPNQLRDHERRRRLGARVYVVDSCEAVDAMLDELC